MHKDHAWVAQSPFPTASSNGNAKVRASLWRFIHEWPHSSSSFPPLAISGATGPGFPLHVPLRSPAFRLDGCSTDCEMAVQQQVIAKGLLLLLVLFSGKYVWVNHALSNPALQSRTAVWTPNSLPILSIYKSPPPTPSSPPLKPKAKKIYSSSSL